MSTWVATSIKTLLFLSLSASLAGCVADDETPGRTGDKPGKYDGIDSTNDPARFDPDLERRFDHLPASGEVRVIPWAGSYWPSAEDSINARWNGGDESPAEKYARAFNRPTVPDEVSRLVGRMSSNETIPSWVGICEGWSAAAIREKPALRSVTRNGVTFLPGDIEGLLSLLYARDNAPATFLSRRCNDEHARFDDQGRAVSAACRDTNPGALHILVTNYLGKKRLSFVEDRTFDAEVWNQPLRGYEATVREISKAQAVELLGGAAATEGETRTILSTRTIRAMEQQSGQVTMPDAGVIHINMTGTGDADLYVKQGSEPTESSYTCRPFEDGSNESCELRAPGGTRLYWMIVGAASSSRVTLKSTVPSGSSGYTYNPAATRFAEVRLDLSYISEAGPGVDRTVPGTDSTVTDQIEYVLELDDEGTIIGGEYLGDSRRKHPDFLWLPTGEPSDTVAGIRYRDVKSLLDAAR